MKDALQLSHLMPLGGGLSVEETIEWKPEMVMSLVETGQIVLAAGARFYLRETLREKQGARESN